MLPYIRPFGYDGATVMNGNVQEYNNTSKQLHPWLFTFIAMHIAFVLVDSTKAIPEASEFYCSVFMSTSKAHTIYTNNSQFFNLIPLYASYNVFQIHAGHRGLMQ